jgi:ABC-type sugar transport system substrate-binding protein
LWKALVPAAAVALSLAACGGESGGQGSGGQAGSEAKGGGDKKEFRVAIVRWDAGDIFFNGVQAGELQQIEKIEKENGVTITHKVVAANDASAQLNGLRSLMAQGVDGVSLVPWRGESMVATLRQLHERKVPVVVHNLTVPGAEYPFVAFDNVEAGRLAGEAMLEQIEEARGADWADKGGVILLLRGDVTASFDKDRFTGYSEAFKEVTESSPNVKVIERANLGYQGEKARKAVDDLITRYGEDNVLGIGSVDGTMAVGGAIGALKTAGATVKEGEENRVPVTSIDCSKPELDSIAKGELAHCSEQPAIAEGELVQNLLFDMMSKGSLEPSEEAQEIEGWDGAPWAPVEALDREGIGGTWYKTKAFAVPGDEPVDSKFHWSNNPGIKGG